VRTISDDERRARLARRHGLAAGARFTDPVTLAGALGGLHATDPATVFLAARARLAQSTVAQIEAALYEQRALLRILGMRRTMFVVRLLEDIGAEAERAVAAEADGVRAWIGEVRVTPRFRTPLERELCNAGGA